MENTDPKGLPPLFPHIGDLFVRTIDVFFNRIGTIAVASLIIGLQAVVAVVIISIVGALVLPKNINWLSGLLILAAVFYLEIYIFLTMLASILKRDASYSECMENGKIRLIPFAWIALLMLFFVTGGLLGFILPGIILLVWFSFAGYIFYIENMTGMEAILKSKHYANGLFWPIFLRLLAVWLATLALSIVPLAGQLLGAFLSTIYTYFLYRDIAEIKKKEEYTSSGFGSIFLITILGFLLFAGAGAIIVKSGFWKNIVLSGPIKALVINKIEQDATMTPEAKQKAIETLESGKFPGDPETGKTTDKADLLDQLVVGAEEAKKGPVKEETAVKQPAEPQPAENAPPLREKNPVIQPSAEKEQVPAVKNTAVEEAPIQNYIIGKVIDAGKKPIPGAAVNIYRDERLVLKGYSNKDGLFKTKSLPVGMYSIEVSKPGYSMRIKEKEVLKDSRTFAVIVLKAND